AQVSHHRDSQLDQPPNAWDDGGTPLELHRLGARLLQKATGCLNSLLRGSIGEKRHIADDERALAPTDHGFGVVEHVVEGHMERRRVAENDIAQRVTHEYDWDARAIGDLCRRIIVRGDHRDPLAALLHLLDIENRGSHTALLPPVSLLFLASIQATAHFALIVPPAWPHDNRLGMTRRWTANRGRQSSVFSSRQS